MTPDLPARRPGTQTPAPVRDSAARAGDRRKPPDMRMLKRVRDALARLPDTALSRSYFEIPGDCLASPHVERSEHPCSR
jgi:hypothetical protein